MLLLILTNIKQICFNISDTKVYFDYIFGHKKNSLFCPVFVFHRGMVNAIYDLVI